MFKKTVIIAHFLFLPLSASSVIKTAKSKAESAGFNFETISQAKKRKRRNKQLSVGAAGLFTFAAFYFFQKFPKKDNNLNDRVKILELEVADNSFNKLPPLKKLKKENKSPKETKEEKPFIYPKYNDTFKGGKLSPEERKRLLDKIDSNNEKRSNLSIFLQPSSHEAVEEHSDECDYFPE